MSINSIFGLVLLFVAVVSIGGHARGRRGGGSQTGIDALILVLRFHELAVDPAKIRHRFANAPFGVSEILRCATGSQDKRRHISVKLAGLAKVPVPALAECRDGRFLVLGRVVDDKVLVQNFAIERPQLMDCAEFEGRWTGRLVLITRRAGLGDLAQEFNIT